MLRGERALSNLRADLAMMHPPHDGIIGKVTAAKLGNLGIAVGMLSGRRVTVTVGEQVGARGCQGGDLSYTYDAKWRSITTMAGACWR